jgi:ABC-type multidrug transport system fused ATPase/permease subunit
MLHQGRVVSEGTYEDLMSDNQEFQRMVMAAS